ncbi:Crp/Fnr family transcriptional regulator [Pseudomonas sp. TH41]|uniref:Crp/Fnr family transcriptional regulator n=1 Tax=Pseudomonas sp. TH41 TaxID=2796405 RepID=UPI0019114D4B|nr:Crp/Fnr family transcriptional regulator [Pseudomonas sp. TH41]MBK5356082.1 Crp/Fnr family transcriptional regulator [Pseudomonas sp. TH41]
MPTVLPTQEGNCLIDSLSGREHNRILRHCEPVDLVYGSILSESDHPLRYLYFPLTGFISLVTTLECHRPLELGLIGNEGMLGATFALGVNAAPTRAVVQGAGRALRINATLLRQELHAYPGLLRALKRYLYVLIAQLSQNAACGHFHEIEPRLARWLLMAHDRAHADHVYLTHERLADMLGVRRSGVSIAAGALQQRQLIRYSRGQITILDRQGLEETACGCYDALIAVHARLLSSHVRH